MYSIKFNIPLIKIFIDSIYNLPSPSNLTRNWSYGSILGLCLIIQIITGLILSIHYSCDVNLSFNSISHIVRDVNFGWALRRFHSNGARIFFIFIYFHIFRGLYYNSFIIKKPWVTGTLILLILIAISFLGYVLPWGQISFWGATVITNLISAIPVLGNSIVIWLWGGFAIGNASLTRFFSFHFVLPFILTLLVVVHLFFLHQSGSSNLLGVRRGLDKIPFHPYFSFIDLIGYLRFFVVYFYISLFTPWGLGDPENFIAANPLVTPLHIQPEWYFLFAYAILRAIPSKLGGVLALFASVIILGVLPFTAQIKYKGRKFDPIRKTLFGVFLTVVLLLTWVGARPVEAPYIFTGQLLTAFYFSYFLYLYISVNFNLNW